MRRTSAAYPCPRSRSPPDLIEFCPFCYANARRRENHKGHIQYTSLPKSKYIPWRETMKRDSNVVSGRPGEWACPDAWFVKSYPNLSAGLCDPFWDDGKPRVCWSLKLLYDGVGAVVTLNDPGLKRVCFTTSRSLDACLKEIEVALAAGTLSWRKSKF